MKQIFLKKTARISLLLSALAATGVSCGDVYDNVRNFSMKEVVYPAHFDTIFVRSGYERVEIDLVKEGRLPSSMIYLGKAKKTVVEYDNEKLEYDSVCSWLNITGLTLPKLYRFFVYTVDEYGNRSVPVEDALTPYTSVDRDALAAPNPNILSLAGFAAVEWPGGLSSDIMDFLSMTYSYTDREGRRRETTTRNELIFVNNVNANEEVTVDVTFWVIPKVRVKNEMVRILDSVAFTQQVEVTMSSDITPVEFVATPSRMALLVGKSKVAVPSLPYGLTWTSSNPAVATVNANGLITARATGTATITVRSEALENATTTVEVTVPDVVGIPAADKLAGVWKFEDGNDLVKAWLGSDLVPYGNGESPGGVFTSIAGPQSTKGVKIGAGSYYAVRHEAPASGGGKNVNEYTLMMDVLIPGNGYSAWRSIFNPLPDNIQNGVVWTSNGLIGEATLGGYTDAAKALQPDTWHRIVFAAQLSNEKRNNAFRLYIDGEYSGWEAVYTEAKPDNITIDGRLSLYADAFYIGYDVRGAGFAAPNFAEIRIWSVRLTDEQIRALGGAEN